MPRAGASDQEQRQVAAGSGAAGPHRVHQPARCGRPGCRCAEARGHLNLVTQTRDELEDTFVAMGFAVAEGPEAETDWYNFEALNMPPDHPARGMWDTLYLRARRARDGAAADPHLAGADPADGVAAASDLRGHARAVLPAGHPRRPPPAGLSPDRGAGRRRGITFGDLAGTIEAFTTAFFGPGIHSRLRPSYFPFTEPSAEFEVTCPICGGSGCRTCSGSGWIELGGCGMVDPNVFAAVGIDPESLQRLRLRLRHRPPGPGAASAWPTCAPCSTTTSASSPSSRTA